MKEPDRLRAVGLAPDTPFATKPQLDRARGRGADGLGDTVHGHSRALRSWLEDTGQHMVLAVPRNEELWAGTDLWRVDEVQAAYGDREWHRLNASAVARRSAGTAGSAGSWPSRRLRTGGITCSFSVPAPMRTIGRPMWLSPRRAAT